MIKAKKCKNNPIARMDKKLIVQSPERVGDGQGGFTETWIDSSTIWASLEPASGFAKFQAHQLDTQITHKCFARFSLELTTSKRIRYGERLFEVKEVINIDEQDQYCWMTLLEIQNQRFELPVFPADTKIITIGDSITQVGNYSDLTFTKISNQGDSYIHWAMRDVSGFKHHVYYDADATEGSAYFRGANFGISAQTATQILTRTDPMINVDAPIAVILCGTNTGTTDVAVASAIRSIRDLVDTLTKQGIFCILGTVWPRVIALEPTGFELTPALGRRIIAINAWIREQASENVAIWDSWNDLIDPAYSPGDDLYGTAKAGMLRDKVHPTPKGAFEGAKSLRLMLRKMMGTDQYDDTWFESDPNNAANRFLDGDLSGTTGTANNGMTGVVASNWVASCANGIITGVASVSANADTGGQTQTLVFTSNGSGAATDFETCSFAPLAFRIDEPSMADGANVKQFFKVRVENPDGVLAALRGQLRNSSTNKYAHGREHTTGVRSDEPWPVGSWEEWIETEALVYNDGNTFICFLYADIFSGISGTVTVHIDTASLLEVAGPAVTFPYDETEVAA